MHQKGTRRYGRRRQKEKILLIPIYLYKYRISKSFFSLGGRSKCKIINIYTTEIGQGGNKVNSFGERNMVVSDGKQPNASQYAIKSKLSYYLLCFKYNL